MIYTVLYGNRGNFYHLCQMKYIKIYTLSHPDTHEIRYVGMTSKSLKERLTNHWSHIYQNNHRTNWIKSLRKIRKSLL